MGLRTIYWLRRQKTDAAGAVVPATSMRAVRRALSRLGKLGGSLWHADETSIWVAMDGEIHVRGPAGAETLTGQTLVPGALNLLAPFPSFALDHNFPAPVLGAFSLLMPHLELVPISQIDGQLARVDDWELFLALHRERSAPRGA